MKILITGGTGLLGKAMIEKAHRNDEIIATFKGEYEIDDRPRVQFRNMDLKDFKGYYKLCKELNPEVIIHTAGVSSPDYAEKYKEEARAINIEGTQNMLKAAQACGAKFIYVSSNGIYDGEHAPYGEEDAIAPINYYGRIKFEGEEITRAFGIPHAIVRPILMYGWNHSFERPNIITQSIAKLRNREKVFVYDDVYSTPLLNYACAGAIWKIISDEKYETFNIGGSERVSVYQLAVRAAKVFGLEERLIEPVKQGFFKELVRRPKDTSYDTRKMKQLLGVEPLSISEGLEIMKAQEGNRDA